MTKHNLLKWEYNAPEASVIYTEISEVLCASAEGTVESFTEDTPYTW